MSATLVHPDGWYPASWRRLPARQMPSYADAAALQAVEERLAHGAPVIASADAARLAPRGRRPGRARRLPAPGRRLRRELRRSGRRAGRGHRRPVRRHGGAAWPVAGGTLVEVARIAGQFAKPRSADVEAHDGVACPPIAATSSMARRSMPRRAQPDPQRMIRAHMQSVGTAASLAAAREAARPIFTSHEALLLPYEQALTRRDAAGRVVGDQRATCCGSATARGRSTAPTSNICAGSTMSSG